MVFGPNMQNFADVVKAASLAQNGAVQVKDTTELEKAAGRICWQTVPAGKSWGGMPARWSGKISAPLSGRLDMIVRNLNGQDTLHSERRLSAAH